MRKLILMAGFLGIPTSLAWADTQSPPRSCALALADFSQLPSLPALSDRILTETLIEPSEVSLDEIQHLLGFRPALRHSVHIYDEALSLLYPGTDRVFARLVFAFQKRKVSVHSLAVVPQFQHRKLATSLFRQLLSRGPIESIETHLSEDNLAAFHRALTLYKDQGLTADELCRRAIEMTPAYRIRKSLGYSRVSSCENGVFHFDEDGFSKRYIRFTVLKD